VESVAASLFTPCVVVVVVAAAAAVGLGWFGLVWFHFLVVLRSK